MGRAPNDARKIFAAQAVRALAYGFGSVLLGATLASKGWSSTRVGFFLTAIVAGAAIASVGLATRGDQFGRRRAYVTLYAGLGIAGAVLALTDSYVAWIVVALTGTLSTDVIESGPFTSLEQAMLPSAGARTRSHARTFGVYNAVAALAGSIGALAAGGPALLRRALDTSVPDERSFLVFVPIAVAGLLIARALSDAVEAPPSEHRRPPLTRSRANVTRLSGLFAVDSFAGGFIVQTFIAYWFHREFGASLGLLGVVFFALGILQTASFLAASWLGERFGLLNTMVFTHLPSNILLMLIPLAPSLPVAIALLLARQTLSQMDVPTRQAYIVALVSPEERTAAAAYTNTARYVTRPVAPAIAGAVQSLNTGLPFFLAGGIKAVYDIALWLWFRTVDLEASEPAR